MAARLTDKQKRFVTEYLVDLNATAAARRAGYSEKTACEQAARLLANVKVQSAVQTAMAKRESRTEITQDKVLREYARIAFFDPRKLFDDEGNPKHITELDDDTAAALAGLDVIKEIDEDGVVTYTKKYKISNKLHALEGVGKHLGMFDGSGGTKPEAREDDALSKSLKELAGELESDD